MMREPTWEVKGQMRPLFCGPHRLLASSGLDLYESTDGGDTFHQLGGVERTMLDQAFSKFPLVARLLRVGFFDLQPLPDGAMVALVRGGIVLAEEPGAEFHFVFREARGSRALRLCALPDGGLYVGEYFANRDRRPVHVFGSEDGRTWDIAFTFPAGAVRHVHGVFHDPWRQGLWVLTGDVDQEAAIWWTSDRFRTLEPVLQGSQRARAVSVLVREDGLIVPTDSPDEINVIQHLDPESGRTEALAIVPGTVFFATESGGLSFVSTVVEKSAVNLEQRPAVYATLDGSRWRPIASFARDLRWLNDRNGYLLYPTVIFPSGDGDGTYLFGGGQSLSRLHGSLLRWSIADVREYLASAA